MKIFKFNLSHTVCYAKKPPAAAVSFSSMWTFIFNGGVGMFARFCARKYNCICPSGIVAVSNRSCCSAYRQL